MNWNSAVEQVGPRLLRYFLGSFSREIAAELVQETIIRLVRKVESGQFDSAKGSLEKFAYGIARLIKLETLKAQGPETPDEKRIAVAPDVDGPSPQEAYEHIDKIRRLRASLSHLPEHQREVLLLVLDDDLSLPEIADILGIPVGTVKSHIHRAKSTLIEIMREKEEIDDGLEQRT